MEKKDCLNVILTHSSEEDLLNGRCEDKRFIWNAEASAEICHERAETIHGFYRRSFVTDTRLAEAEQPAVSIFLFRIFKVVKVSIFSTCMAVLCKNTTKVL